MSLWYAWHTARRTDRFQKLPSAIRGRTEMKSPPRATKTQKIQALHRAENQAERAFDNSPEKEARTEQQLAKSLK